MFEILPDLINFGKRIGVFHCCVVSSEMKTVTSILHNIRMNLSPGLIRQPLVFLTTTGLLFFFSSGTTDNALTKNYSVYFESKKIGTLKVTKKTNGKNCTYNLVSDVLFNVVINYRIKEVINDEFREDKLHASTHTRHINDESKADNKIKRVGNVYELTSNGKKGQDIAEWIKQTALSIYFKEPEGGDRIYSQNHQQLITLSKLSEGQYELIQPGNRKTIYQYNSGELKLLESVTSFGHVKFVKD